VGHAHGADSEIGRLRTVLVHRPGPELRRITPRSADRLLFDVLPWVGRAQEEHDALTSVLRGQGAEVLYLTELLQDALEYEHARGTAIASVLASATLGDELRAQLRGYLDRLDPEALARVLIAGLARHELTSGRGVVFELLDRHDFVIDPLPNLTFLRDSSVWIGDRVAVTGIAARRRESELLGVIYRYHPRFAGTKCLQQPAFEQVDGGDVLLLAPGVIAIGVGRQTTPAGAERLARRVFDAGLAHTVLAVPLVQLGAAAHLDTACTVVDVDTVIMHPRVAFALTAHTITPRADGMRVSRPQPFLGAAAQAMGIDRLQVIETGLDPLTASRRQWDDGGNALAIDRRIAVCHERNVETNARLEAAGVRVITVPASELGSHRGGPRCMACPVARDPAASPDAGAPPGELAARYVAAPDQAMTQPGRSPRQPLGQLAPAG
jgi:arginine deiminase